MYRAAQCERQEGTSHLKGCKTSHVSARAATKHCLTLLSSRGGGQSPRLPGWPTPPAPFLSQSRGGQPGQAGTAVRGTGNPVTNTPLPPSSFAASWPLTQQAWNGGFHPRPPLLFLPQEPRARRGEEKEEEEAAAPQAPA